MGKKKSRFASEFEFQLIYLLVRTFNHFVILNFKSPQNSILLDYFSDRVMYVVWCQDEVQQSSILMMFKVYQLRFVC